MQKALSCYDVMVNVRTYISLQCDSGVVEYAILRREKVRRIC